MKNRKSFCFLLMVGLIAFTCKSMCKPINLPATTYYYSKISKNNVLHDNSYSKDDLHYLYKDIQIKIIGDNLEIPNICSMKINLLEQKPINFWHSFETEKLYNTLFKEEDLSVKNQITFITSLYPDPDKSCPEPFNELIVQDHQLIALRNGYLILFSDQISPPIKKVNEDGFICKDLTFPIEDGYMNGNSCFFPNQQLSAIYEQYWKKAQGDKDEKHLRKALEPMKDYQDIIEDGYLYINYHWRSVKELKIEFSFAGGVTTLVFKENDEGTELTTIYSAD